MKHVAFKRVMTGETIGLRPTHAMKVAEALSCPISSIGVGLNIRPDDLNRAAGRVRDACRCRDARKDLRRLALMAREAGENKDYIVAVCHDQDVMRDMVKASAGRRV